MQTIKGIITTTEPLLGSANANPKIYEDFIASKMLPEDKSKKLEEELRSLPLEEQVEKATTVFPRDDKGLHLWDYHLRGKIKDAIGIAVELGLEAANGVTKWTYKRAVDQLVFVSPRRVYAMRGGAHITKPDGIETRPLRATTLQGDRVALASSERLDPGVEFAFEITWLTAKGKSKLIVNEELIVWALDYGKLNGLGQWRGGGFGRFTWKRL